MIKNVVFQCKTDKCKDKGLWTKERVFSGIILFHIHPFFTVLPVIGSIYPCGPHEGCECLKA